MATNALPSQSAKSANPPRGQEPPFILHLLLLVANSLASLRLTVALFAAAIVLVFAGTLAQVDKEIWQVMNEYFRTFFAWIDFQVFFPKSFFSGEAPHVPGGMYFPGGWTIGGLMGINLLAAHLLRFKVQAQGTRLWAGVGVIAAGIALTWLVVMGGSGKDTVEGGGALDWSALWIALKWSLVGVWMVGIYLLTKFDPKQTIARWSVAAGCTTLGAVILWVFWAGEGAALGDSSMRILWQLIKGGLASLLLLAGCVMVFRKRAGIVLLHAGVALVMANELVVYQLHVEGQMQIKEGETVNYVYDIRTVELAVVDGSNPKTDDVVVVPRSLLQGKQPVRDEQLPFDVDVVQYLQNSTLEKVKTDGTNKATTGVGLQTMAEPRRAGTGTDAGGKVDMTAAYVKLTAKDGKPLGTYLVGVALPNQKVTVGDKSYDIALRFKRTYKPYAMKLEDVRFDKYLGTQTAKNYSSDVHLTDPTRQVDRDVKIWMNNPLRFAGETFYQSSYFADGDREGTILQVVTNTGWMIPYVACMIVGIGMLAQFSITLVRFLNRQSDLVGDDSAKTELSKSARKKLARSGAADSSKSWTRWYLPAAVVGLAAVWVVSAARPARVPVDQMKLDEFGRLPVVHEGRVKPLDTVARNMLRYLSGKQTFTDTSGKAPKKQQPAIKWFLDEIASPDAARQHAVFRIENPEVLKAMGLERREGLRYSINEFRGHVADLERQADLASKLDPAKVTIDQKKMLELVKKLQMVRLLEIAFDPPQLRPDHAQEDLKIALHQLDALSRMQPILAIPPDKKDGEWEPFAAAWFNGLKARARNEQPNPAMVQMTALIVAYSKGDVEAFNSNLAAYQQLLHEQAPADFDESKVNFEAFFNSFEPFYLALVLYVVAFVMVAVGWLRWTEPLNRAAFWLILFALGVHTFALAGRIYISGRPPVTNLYSSAVFIGWGGVILGLILERVYQLGIGNVIAAVAGFTTLLIANFLAGLTDGDTLGVLQAVLDTQFWLATHVVCITLGYTTTFVAGLLGVIYILGGVFTRSLSPNVAKDLTRMIYGTVCFAMFFSFVGTVLGGLWADDSWGRFWGWDPKENGALMIVLWNALVLHARWGGIVKQRGLAALAVGGNIVTGWSWFGVNELGVGLHSYGFTEGVLMALGLFVLSQLLLIGAAALPRPWWRSQAGTAAV